MRQAVGEIYHICNRGVDGREIFLNDGDYLRGVHDLFEFNNQDIVSNTAYSFKKSVDNFMGIGYPYIEIEKKRTLLVEVLAFVLMPNHYHLLLRPCVDSGIPLFIRKFNGGYARYFNKRYERSGALFRGKYRCKHVDTPEYFEYVLYYVHANALDLVYPEWREGKLQNAAEVLEYLETYRWSSFPDYAGWKNFPSVIQREYLRDLLTGNPREYRNRFMNWLSDFETNRDSLMGLE